MVDTKRCPKCGREHAWIIRYRKPRQLFDRWYVQCWWCHYCGKGRLTKKRAIKAWNKIRRD